MKIGHRSKVWNGLNLNKSVTNVKSRLIRLLSYLWNNGPRRKEEILKECFVKNTGNRSWGSYLFTMARYKGFVETTRIGRNVVWSITDKGLKVLEEVTK